MQKQYLAVRGNSSETEAQQFIQSIIITLES